MAVMGPERLGQVDGDEHPGLPGYAHVRRVPFPGPALSSAATATSARCCAGITSASSSRASTCWRARRPRRTSSCRCSTAASRPRRARQAGRAGPGRGRAWRAGSTTPRPSSPAASSSGWPSPGPSSPTHRAAGRRAHRQPRHHAQPRDHGPADQPEPRAGHHRARWSPTSRTWPRTPAAWSASSMAGWPYSDELPDRALAEEPAP